MCQICRDIFIQTKFSDEDTLRFLNSIDSRIQAGDAPEHFRSCLDHLLGTETHKRDQEGERSFELQKRDPSMESDQKKRLEEIEYVIREMRLGDEIDDAVFHKNLVNIAYDYITCNIYSQANRLLRSCTEEYFREVMPVQMLADPEFCEVAYRLAKVLIDQDIVQVGRMFNFGNTKPGSA